MKQIYVNFKERTPKTGPGDLIPTVDACVPISSDVLPPLAEKYFDLVRQKGFIKKGDPILYVTANEIGKDIPEGRNVITYNLVAEWPSLKGYLEKEQGNKGSTGLNFYYITEPVELEEFEELTKSSLIQDYQASVGNLFDISKLLANAPWKANMTFSAKRISRDTDLPVSFLEEISHHEDFKALTIKRGEEVSLSEGVMVEYEFGEGLLVENVSASASLEPSDLISRTFGAGHFEERDAPNRIPKAWNVVDRATAMSAFKGTEDYSWIVNSILNRSIPSESPTGEKMENILEHVAPNLIDALDEFIE